MSFLSKWGGGGVRVGGEGVSCPAVADLCRGLQRELGFVSLSRVRRYR